MTKVSGSNKTSHRVLRGALVPALLVCAGLFAAGGDATAQKSDKAKSASKGDKKIASKKGVEGSLGQKEIDADKLPGKLEVGIAFGSFAAMIAAFKYL